MLSVVFWNLSLPLIISNCIFLIFEIWTNMNGIRLLFLNNSCLWIVIWWIVILGVWWKDTRQVLVLNLILNILDLLIKSFLSLSLQINRIFFHFHLFLFQVKFNIVYIRGLWPPLSLGSSLLIHLRGLFNISVADTAIDFGLLGWLIPIGSIAILVKRTYLGLVLWYHGRLFLWFP